MLCAPEGAENAWPGLVLDDETATGALLLERLAALLAQTRAMLADPEFGFVPLLPDEAGSLAQQLEGLAGWCRGFLLGFSAGGDRELRVLSSEAREFLEDMVRMSDAELEAEGTDDGGRGSGARRTGRIPARRGAAVIRRTRHWPRVALIL